MAVVISYFNKATRYSFENSDLKKMGSDNKINRAPGTIFVLSDYETKEVFGICTIKKWEYHDSPCRLFCPLDDGTYNGQNSKYNKYEICIDKIHLLRNPISYDKIKILLGVANGDKHTNNMWKGNLCCNAETFYKGADNEYITRFNIWATSLL